LPQKHRPKSRRNRRRLQRSQGRNGPTRGHRQQAVKFRIMARRMLRMVDQAHRGLRKARITRFRSGLNPTNRLRLAQLQRRRGSSRLLATKHGLSSNSSNMQLAGAVLRKLSTMTTGRVAIATVAVEIQGCREVMICRLQSFQLGRMERIKDTVSLTIFHRIRVHTAASGQVKVRAVGSDRMVVYSEPSTIIGPPMTHKHAAKQQRYMHTYWSLMKDVHSFRTSTTTTTTHRNPYDQNKQAHITIKKATTVHRRKIPFNLLYLFKQRIKYPRAS